MHSYGKMIMQASISKLRY